MEQKKQQTRSYSSGEVIFRQGDADVSVMYDIWNGSVNIFDGYGTPEQVRLATLGNDSLFGVIGLVTGKPRAFTAVAAEKTEIVTVDTDTFRSYFSQRPAKLLVVMEQLDNRIEAKAKNYIRLYREIYQAYQKDPSQLHNGALREKLEQTLCSEAQG